MKYETIKSILLVILIVVSGALTWNIWTYQPKLEFDDNKNVHDISISDQVDAIELIKPTKVIYHLDGAHYGTSNDEEIAKLVDEISTWSFYDIGPPKIQNNKQISALSHEDNRVEISFPDLVPLDLYRGIIHLDMKNAPKIAFDKMVIALAEEAKEEASIFLIATDEGKVYESHVNKNKIEDFHTIIKRNKSSHAVYGEYNLPGGRKIYLPDQKVLMNRYQYLSDYVDPEKFKNALFKVPSIVRKDTLGNEGEQFTDVFSLMNVDYASNMIFYVNPTQEQDQVSAGVSSNLLKQSINFVNEHGGWTDNYRYFSMSPYEKMTSFRLFMQGYPVFNDQGMAEIRQYWGKEEIYQYKRPYFSLEVEFSSTLMEVPSGGEALNELLSDPEFKPELLEDMTLGYRLKKDEQHQKMLVLEPNWYYLSAGSWIRVIFDDVRGIDNGLE